MPDLRTRTRYEQAFLTLGTDHWALSKTDRIRSLVHSTRGFSRGLRWNVRRTHSLINGHIDRLWMIRSPSTHASNGSMERGIVGSLFMNV